MIKLVEVFTAIAYSSKGNKIVKKGFGNYPSKEDLEQFANGYQQADYIKVEKEFRYIR